LKKDFLEILWL